MYGPKNSRTKFKRIITHKEYLELPVSINLKKDGYVTRVRDQEDCGSCWAFTAVAILEGQLFKNTGKLVELSEQNILDWYVFFSYLLIYVKASKSPPLYFLN